MDFDYWKSKALEENPSLRESKPVVTDPGKYDTEIPLPLSDEEVIASEPVRTDDSGNNQYRCYDTRYNR